MLQAARALYLRIGLLLVGAVVPTSAGAKSPPAANVPVDPSAPMTLEAEKVIEDTEELGAHVGVMSILSTNYNFENGAAIDMLLIQGELHWADPHWRLVAHPRVKVRPVGTIDSKPSVFFQEIFGSYRQGDVAELKVGKIYEQFGRVWDYGVYGPLVANTDLKLRGDIGISLEGAPRIQRNLTLAYALQFFLMDGQSIAIHPGSGWSLSRMTRHTNIVVGRIAPTLHLDELGNLGFGLSVKRHTSFGADPQGHQVLTMAADVTYTRGPLDTFVEAGYQNGSSAALASPTNNYSVNNSIDPYTYVWAGAAYDIASFNVRFNVSSLFYRDAPGSVEVLYQPGVGYRIGDNRELEIAIEGAFASSSNPAARTEKVSGWKERAVYLVAVGRI